MPKAAKWATARRRKADRGHGLLIVEDFDVDEPGRVVDADVDVLPADVKRASVVAAAGDAAGDTVARPRDPAELLDIDVDELARPPFLVAVGRARAAPAARACQARSGSRSPKRLRPAPPASRRSRHRSSATGAKTRSDQHATRPCATAPTTALSNDPADPARLPRGSGAATSRPCARSRSEERRVGKEGRSRCSPRVR